MSLKKKLKKIGKAAAIAGTAYLATKAMSGAGAGVNVDKGRGSALSQRYRKPYKDAIMSGGKGTQKGSMSLMQKISNTAAKVKDSTSKFAKSAGAATKKVMTENVNLGRGPNIKKTDSIANKVLSGNVFGLGDMDGAKAGGMMYANKGTYVKAKCKLGRNKKTLLA